MNHNAAVDPQSLVAVEAPGPECPDPADDGIFPRGGLVEGGVLPREPRGAQQRGVQMSFLVYIQSLLQLVDDNPVGIVHRQFLQQLRLHVSLEPGGPDFNLGALLRRGVGFDQRPVPFLAQDVNPLAGAGHDPDVILAVFLRPGADTDLIPLLPIQHVDGLGQHLPDDVLVHLPFRHLPEAEIVLAQDLAVLIRRPEHEIVRRQRLRQRGGKKQNPRQHHPGQPFSVSSSHLDIPCHALYNECRESG